MARRRVRSRRRGPAQDRVPARRRARPGRGRRARRRSRRRRAPRVPDRRRARADRARQRRGLADRVRGDGRRRRAAARLRLLRRRLRLPLPTTRPLLTEDVAAARDRAPLLLGPEGQARGRPARGHRRHGDRRLRVSPVHRRRPRRAGADHEHPLRPAARAAAPAAEPALGGRSSQRSSGCPRIKPVLPDPGIRFQLVHHDDVAAAMRSAVLGRGEPGRLQPRRSRAS